MNEDTERKRPFSSSSQAADWFALNCDRCALSNAYREAGACDIEQALALAYLDDGTVDPAIARRMGYLKPDGTTSGAHVWMCTEVEWTEEWKAEILAWWESKENKLWRESKENKS